MGPLDDIKTPRLVLRLMGEEAIASCLTGELEAAQRLLGATIPVELLENTAGLEFNQIRSVEDPRYLPWSMRAIIEPDRAMMIGHIRFHTRPDPEYLHSYARDAVEFGYHIFTPYRRLGYATEAASGVMEWAQALFGVNRFIASVSPDNQPSRRLIVRLGFAQVGTWLDDVDGPEDVFLLSTANAVAR
jgi:[ribosomal protein S5]-alanine N-acetyltransferase